jgi:hypothetical protein
MDVEYVVLVANTEPLVLTAYHLMLALDEAAAT